MARYSRITTEAVSRQLWNNLVLRYSSSNPNSAASFSLKLDGGESCFDPRLHMADTPANTPAHPETRSRTKGSTGYFQKRCSDSEARRPSQRRTTASLSRQQQWRLRRLHEEYYKGRPTSTARGSASNTPAVVESGEPVPSPRWHQAMKQARHYVFVVRGGDWIHLSTKQGCGLAPSSRRAQSSVSHLIFAHMHTHDIRYSHGRNRNRVRYALLRCAHDRRI